MCEVIFAMLSFMCTNLRRYSGNGTVHPDSANSKTDSSLSLSLCVCVCVCVCVFYIYGKQTYTNKCTLNVIKDGWLDRNHSTSIYLSIYLMGKVSKW